MRTPGARHTTTRKGRLLGDERGFTLPELTIVIALMGILAAIAIPVWGNILEGRKVDAATNQLAADLRLAHSSSTNRLENWQVKLTSGSSAYQIGAAGGTPRNRSLCGDDGCGPRDPKVTFSGGSPVTVTFESDGTLLANAPTFKVAVDGDPPDHDLQINSVTSRVAIDP